MSTIFSGSEVTVRHHHVAHDILCITFSNLNYSFPDDAPGFAEAFLLSQRVSSLHFVSKRNHWWQPTEIDEAINSVLDHGILDGYRQRVGYGSSMGAYGALLFSRALAMNRVIAFCPQYCVNPADVPWEKRYLSWTASLPFRQPPLEDAVSETAAKLIVFDPLDKNDRQHAKLCAQLPNTKQFAVPFSGHPATTFWSETKLLKNFVLNAINHDVTISEWIVTRRSHRTASPSYWLNLAKEAVRRRPALAISCAHRCLSYSVDNAEAWYLIGLGHEKLGRQRLAFSGYYAATSLNPKHETFAYHRRRLAEAIAMSL